MQAEEIVEGEMAVKDEAGETITAEADETAASAVMEAIMSIVFQLKKSAEKPRQNAGLKRTKPLQQKKRENQ